MWQFCRSPPSHSNLLGTATPWNLATYVATGNFDGNLLNEHLHAAAVISSEAIIGMAAEGPLPRSEVAVKLGSLLNLESFTGTLKAALRYQLPDRKSVV